MKHNCIGGIAFTNSNKSHYNLRMAHLFQPTITEGRIHLLQSADGYMINLRDVCNALEYSTGKYLINYWNPKVPIVNEYVTINTLETILKTAHAHFPRRLALYHEIRIHLLAMGRTDMPTLRGGDIVQNRDIGVFESCGGCDMYADFIGDELVAGKPDEHVHVKEIYVVFKDWFQQTNPGKKPVLEKEFRRKMEAKLNIKPRELRWFGWKRTSNLSSNDAQIGGESF
jgi:hypothetical protein